MLLFTGAKVATNDTIYHKISFISYHLCCIVTSVTLLETIILQIQFLTDELLDVVNLININTCIFWCKISGLFIHWYISCDYMTFVIRQYDKCRINAWHMSRNRKKGFLASYNLRHCYHPSHPCQFARRGMWRGRGYLLYLRTWEGAENGGGRPKT